MRRYWANSRGLVAHSDNKKILIWKSLFSPFCHAINSIYDWKTNSKGCIIIWRELWFLLIAVWQKPLKGQSKYLVKGALVRSRDQNVTWKQHEKRHVDLWTSLRTQLILLEKHGGGCIILWDSGYTGILEEPVETKWWLTALRPSSLLSLVVSS